MHDDTRMAEISIYCRYREIHTTMAEKIKYCRCRVDIRIEKVVHFIHDNGSKTKILPK